jgi:hypothetical protein
VVTGAPASHNHFSVKFILFASNKAIVATTD